MTMDSSFQNDRAELYAICWKAEYALHAIRSVISKGRFDFLALSRAEAALDDITGFTEHGGVLMGLHAGQRVYREKFEAFFDLDPWK